MQEYADQFTPLYSKAPHAAVKERVECHFDEAASPGHQYLASFPYQSRST